MARIKHTGSIMDGDYTRKYRRTGSVRDSKRSKPYLDRNLRRGQAAYNYSLAQRRVKRGFTGVAGDYKYIDIALGSYGHNTTGSLTHISPIAQGTTVNQRDGRSCRVTSVQIRGNIQGAIGAVPQTVATYLVWDYQPNKALASISDILDGSSAKFFPKRENYQRFKILKTWRYKIVGANDGAPVSTESTIHDIDEYVRLPRDAVITCTTADTTGAIGNVVTGALLFVTTGDEVSADTGAVSTLRMRVNFMDV